MELKTGAKFIGLVILYISTVNNTYKLSNLAIDNLWIIIFVSIIMFFGVQFGGRKIVENIGKNTVPLDNVKGIFSDLATSLNLFIASIYGIPVSTTHVKTMSIISLGEEKVNIKNIKNVFKAWIWTFPVCFVLGYLISKLLINIL